MNYKQYFNEKKEPCNYNVRTNKKTQETFKSWALGRGASLEPVGVPSKSNLEYIGSDPRFYTGINFGEGISKDGYNLVCLDLDVKQIQEEEKRNQYFIKVMDKFDISLDYPNVERTKSKGYHIWVIVPTEELISDGVLWTKTKWVLDPGVELEIFVSGQAVVVYDKKSLNKETMIKLKEIPNIPLVRDSGANKHTSKKDYLGVDPLIAEELTELYKKLYPGVGRDYSTLEISRIKESDVYVCRSWSNEEEKIRVQKLKKVYKFLEVKGKPGAVGYTWNPKTKECKKIERR
ncbi:MAG: hypothetical protein ACRC6U_00715 [Fusobacteriaceae bacterium]